MSWYGAHIFAIMSHPNSISQTDDPFKDDYVSGVVPSTSSKPQSKPPPNAVTDTPRRAHRTDHSKYHENVSLDGARKMAVMDLEGYVPEVELQYFKSSVLPPLSKEQLDKLRVAVSSLVDTEKDCWDSFEKDPCCADGIEDVVFRPFPVLLNSIIAKVAEDLGHAKELATWKAQGKPTETLHFENNLHATFRPDAFAALRTVKGAGIRPGKFKVPVEKDPPSPLLRMLMLVTFSTSLPMSLRMPPMWFSFANSRRRMAREKFWM